MTGQAQETFGGQDRRGRPHLILRDVTALTEFGVPGIGQIVIGQGNREFLVIDPGEDHPVHILIEDHRRRLAMAGLAAHPKMRIMGRPFTVYPVTGEALSPHPGPVGRAGHVDMAVDTGYRAVTALSEGFRRHGQGNGLAAPFPLEIGLPVAFQANPLHCGDPLIGLGIGPPMTIQTDPFLPVQLQRKHFRFLGQAGDREKDSSDQGKKKD